MLRDRVEEILNNPGNALAVELGGASGPGMQTFLQAFGPGVPNFYVMEGGSLWEAGEGSASVGPPSTYNRSTVLANSAGNTSRMNFTGATRIFNFIPASRAVYKQQLDAILAASEGGAESVQNNLNAEITARAAADTALNNYITAVENNRNNTDLDLYTRINSVEATRASQDAALSNAINAANAARASQDVAYRNVQIADDNYYRSLQVNDDNALAATLRAELANAPVSRITGFTGAWGGNNGPPFDPVWETTFFDVALPNFGPPVVRIFGHVSCRVRHPMIGEGGAGENGQMVRVYLQQPGGGWLAQPQAMLVWAAAGTYNSYSATFRFEQTGIPPGSYLRVTCERTTKDGGGTVQIHCLDVGGICVLGG